MEFIAIRNKGTLDRRLLELVGLSTKKGKDVGRIGFKGSGTKLAAIAAVRSGLKTSIASSDAHGQYFLFFSSNPIKIEDGDTFIETEQVVYRYWRIEDGNAVEADVHKTHFVTDGFADWDTPIGADGNETFKIVREHACNAFDADRDFSIEIIDAPGGQLYFAPQGETVVYIECTEKVRAIVEEVERYFKFLRLDIPVAKVAGIGEVWPKSDPATTRLFIRGVLVACHTESTHATLYDYSLDNRELLSEERVLKSEYSYQAHIGAFLMNLRDESFVGYLLEQMREGRAQYELRALCTVSPEGRSYQEGKEFWIKAAHRVFGPKIAVPGDDEYANLEAGQMYGYTVIGRSNQQLRQFLRIIGVPSTETVVPRTFDERIEQVSFDELPQKSREAFYWAFSRFAKHFPDYAKAYPIAFFRATKPKDEVIANVLGFAKPVNGVYSQIWIKVDQKARLPDPADVLETLIHEARHCVTGAGDHGRRFVDAADVDIVMAVYRDEGAMLYKGMKEVRGWGDPATEPRFVPMGDQYRDTLELNLDGVIFLPEIDDKEDR